MPPRRELKDMEALVEEILKRLPPDEPKHLLHASLVCKHWYRLLSDDGFRSRYRAFHKTPPMLGFFPTLYHKLQFISTTGPTLYLPHGPVPRPDYSLEDCRHGRALLQYHDKQEKQPHLVVWDPMTGCTSEPLREPWRGEGDWDVDCTAVLCAADGCDHGDCQLGPFLVVSLSFDKTEGVATAAAYSSETSNWSSPATLANLEYFDPGQVIYSMPSVLAGGAVYFPITGEFVCIFKYDLRSSLLSQISMPLQIWDTVYDHVLVAAEDGRLGLAQLVDFELSVWWMELGPDQAPAWAQPLVVDLKDHLPIGCDDPGAPPAVLVGSIEGTHIVFATTDLGTYMIDFKSLTSKKISSEMYRSDDLWQLFPYRSFYIPPEQDDSGESEFRSSDEESECRSRDEESEELEARADAGHGNDVEQDDSGESEFRSSDEESEFRSRDEESEELEARTDAGGTDAA